MEESFKFRPPENIDKGEVDETKLIELYSHFGSYLEADSKPVESLNGLEKIYGDCSNELLYMRENGLVRTIADGSLQVKLRDRERELAKDLYKLEIEGLMPDEIAENEEILPNYIHSPHFPGHEEFKEKEESWGTQNPSEELIGRLVNTVPRKNGLKPHRISEKMKVETNFPIETWLRYLETQEVVESRNGKYSLQTSDEVNELLNESKETHSESLKQRQRFQNNPWKL